MATLTVYPDAGSGSTTVDGVVERTGVNESSATIRAGAGTGVDKTSTSGFAGRIVCSGTTNQYATVSRAIYHFDTSTLTSAATISSAVLSLIQLGSTFNIGGGDARLVIVSSTVTSNNDLASSDYSQVGSTSFASTASWGASGTYQDFTLNASGISNINKTGVSKFASRDGSDYDGTLPWSNGATNSATTRFADQTGTSADPKLTITYTADATVSVTDSPTVTESSVVNVAQNIGNTPFGMKASLKIVG